MDKQIMNQIAEDMTDDDEPQPLSVVEKPKSEFVRPAYQFKGVDLFPFTYGYELLFNQVRDAEDTGLYTWLAFVFLLRKRTPGEDPRTHRYWAQGIAWKVQDFRCELTQWMDENGPFTTDDKLEAKRIYEESMKAIAESVVESVPDRKRIAQKKTSRPRKQQSFTSSDINLDARGMKSSGKCLEPK